MTNEKEKRELIRSIRSDINLSDEEKKKKISQIMMGKYFEESNKIHHPKSCFNKTCEHYPNKKCYKFYFGCCQVYDTCTRCHKSNGCVKKDKDKDIILKKITCSECDLEQEPGEFCSGCSIKFSQSHCLICKVWTNKEIYHCESCGICRIGTKESLFHCDICEVCFPIESKDNHICYKGLREAKCVVCNDETYNSNMEFITPYCGHVAHVNCLKELISHNQYKCVVCRKSFVNMDSEWKRLKTLIINTPITNEMLNLKPDDIMISPYGKFKIKKKKITEKKDVLWEGEFIDWIISFKQEKKYAKGILSESILEKYVGIYCNDCRTKSSVKYHFYGLECKSCGSFNTQQ